MFAEDVKSEYVLHFFDFPLIEIVGDTENNAHINSISGNAHRTFAKFIRGVLFFVELTVKLRTMQPHLVLMAVPKTLKLPFFVVGQQTGHWLE